MGLIPFLSPISIVSQVDVCFVLNQLKMRYVAAYLLAQLGGNDAPDAAAIKAILGSVGVDADEEKMNKVISELSGKAIADVLAEGKEKLASVPSGGGAAQLLVVLPPVVLKKLQLLKPRRNHHPRMKTKIWDSVFSTKKRRHVTHTVYVLLLYSYGPVKSDIKLI